MNEQDKEHQSVTDFKQFFPSAALVGAIFGVISFVIGLYFGYQQINSEPTGSLFSPMLFSGVVICLLTSFAGLVAVWHFTKEVTSELSMGQGAALGFLAGAVVAVVSVLLNEVWVTLVDPEYTEKMIESSIAAIEIMDLPESAKDDMIDAMSESIEQGATFGRQLFIGIPVNGLLNLITALIGVKIFADKKESF
ncbi:MAG: DUF4199 family protein [Balneolaceae bacterium]|jgi:uncharacterized membrane protein YagU involved in acid resistance|nr:MAG: DUF4199 family protein [Balneolaceae bacterium]